ncbi:hypothetical protein EDC04DRAFT_2605844 [Pisolithus marmoratus]|nr:hypothetical protein EDC04DRAFT_2605844 [Pisolithus marmoratus]
MPPQYNKFWTVDAIYKLGSYPVPMEGRSIVTMDKIMAQELQGAVVIFGISSGCNFLGLCSHQYSLTGQIDGAMRHNNEASPQDPEIYPHGNEIPLYNADTWNWPLPRDMMAPTDRKSKGGWKELHLAAFFNATLTICQAPLRVLVLIIKHQTLSLTPYHGQTQKLLPNIQASSISPPFNIYHNPNAVVAILVAVMFSLHQCIGFDPTVTSTCANVPDSIPKESEDIVDHIAHPEPAGGNWLPASGTFLSLKSNSVLEKTVQKGILHHNEKQIETGREYPLPTALQWKLRGKSQGACIYNQDGVISVQLSSDDFTVWHEPADDIESLFYACIWTLVLYDGPLGWRQQDFDFESSILNKWSEDAIQNPWNTQNSKFAFIVYDAHYPLQKCMSPYFYNLIPLADDWWKIFQKGIMDRKAVNISSLLEVTKSFLSRMLPEDPPKIMNECLTKQAEKDALHKPLPSTPVKHTAGQGSGKKHLHNDMIQSAATVLFAYLKMLFLHLPSDQVAHFMPSHSPSKKASRGPKCHGEDTRDAASQKKHKADITVQPTDSTSKPIELCCSSRAGAGTGGHILQLEQAGVVIEGQQHMSRPTTTFSKDVSPNPFTPAHPSCRMSKKTVKEHQSMASQISQSSISSFEQNLDLSLQVSASPRNAGKNSKDNSEDDVGDEDPFCEGYHGEDEDNLSNKSSKESDDEPEFHRFRTETQSNQVVWHTSMPPKDNFEYSHDEAEENAAASLWTHNKSPEMQTINVLDCHQQKNGYPCAPDPAILTALHDRSVDVPSNHISHYGPVWKDCLEEVKIKCWAVHALSNPWPKVEDGC